MILPPCPHRAMLLWLWWHRQVHAGEPRLAEVCSPSPQCPPAWLPHSPPPAHSIQGLGGQQRRLSGTCSELESEVKQRTSTPSGEEMAYPIWGVQQGGREMGGSRQLQGLTLGTKHGSNALPEMLHSDHQDIKYCTWKVMVTQRSLRQQSYTLLVSSPMECSFE